MIFLSSNSLYSKAYLPLRPLSIVKVNGNQCRKSQPVGRRARRKKNGKDSGKRKKRKMKRPQKVQKMQADVRTLSTFCWMFRTADNSPTLDLFYVLPGIKKTRLYIASAK